jgi:hypothetical protein
MKDNAHFDAYRAHELARCIVEGIKKNHLAIARFLVDDAPFDPSHPDSVESFSLPANPFTKKEPPLRK